MKYSSSSFIINELTTENKMQNNSLSFFFMTHFVILFAFFPSFLINLFTNISRNNTTIKKSLHLMKDNFEILKVRKGETIKDSLLGIVTSL